MKLFEKEKEGASARVSRKLERSDSVLRRNGEG